MNALNLTGLPPAVAERIAPLFDAIIAAHSPNLHSLTVVGSAVIPDYDPKVSDVNSVVVLRDMDLGFLSFLAPLGKQHGKKRVAAPLVMTPAYITSSLDAFPIEFLDFQLIHRTVYGEDLFRDLVVDRANLRIQCEREIKTKLIGLRQGYLSSLGKKEQLSQTLVRLFTGSMALFRAVIVLFGKEPPTARQDVITTLGVVAGDHSEVYRDLLALKAGRLKLTDRELHALFERYYHALETTGSIIDELPA